MRVVFLTQGSAVRLFHETALRLDALVGLESLGWFVADRSVFRSLADTPLFRRSAVAREWAILDAAEAEPGLADRVPEVEAALGVHSLWPALIADRRYIHGALVKVRQDYASPYSHRQLAALAVATYDALRAVFDDVKPAVVISFSPNTLGAMIGAWLACARGIPCLTLKSTKVSNLVTLSADYSDRHPHIETRLTAFRKGEAPSEAARAFASRFLEETRARGVTYEGVQRPAQSAIARQAFAFLRGLPRVAASDLRHRGRDPQRLPAMAAHYHASLGRALRSRRAMKTIEPCLVSADDLGKVPYVVFPLNSEPEITVSVYNPFYRNQIEVVRAVAQSLPISMKLVVKDHPRSWGLRSTGYYRRLIEIPNVQMAPVHTAAGVLARDARAVVVLSSFVGFEAILAGRPVVTLGNCLYDMLSRPFVWKASALHELPDAIAGAVSAKLPADNRDLTAFLAAVFEQSIPLDLYTQLLRKGARESGTAAVDTAAEDPYERLARYILQRAHAERFADRANDAA